MQHEQTMKTIVPNRFITLKKIVSLLFVVRCMAYLCMHFSLQSCVPVLGGIFYANVIVSVVVVIVSETTESMMSFPSTTTTAHLAYGSKFEMRRKFFFPPIFSSVHGRLGHVAQYGNHFDMAL